MCAVGLIIYLISTIKTPYKWDASLSHESKEPFGTALFDKLMESSLPGGYEIKEDINDELNPNTDAILYLKDDIYFYEGSQEKQRADKLVQFVKNGGVVIISTFSLYIDSLVSCPLDLKKAVESNNEYSIDIPDKVRSYKDSIKPKIIISCLPESKDYEVHQFMVYAHDLFKYYDKKKHSPILTFSAKKANGKNVLAFTREYDKGGIIEYVSTPLFFTNYAILDSEASNVTKHLLGVIGKRHLVRIEGVNHYNTENKVDNHDVFSYILSQPSLRWALNILMITLALFCFFTMRRKMRPIPLLPKQSNATLEFAKFMGTFYYRRGKHNEFVVQRYDALMKQLEDVYGWNTKNMGNKELSRALSIKTGEPEEKLIQLIRKVGHLRHNYRIEQKTMMELIDYITEIKKKL